MRSLQLGQMGQLGGEITVQLALPDSPAPVAAMQAGSIHAGFAAQAQDILQGDDAEIGGEHCAANKRPMDAVFAVPKIGLCISLLVFCGARIPPAGNRVVVVVPVYMTLP